MAGYSSTPLAKKLGIKSKDVCIVIQEPDQYWNWLSPLPEDISFTKKGQASFIHLFVKDQSVFEKLMTTYKKQLAKDGMMWISWPKKTSKVETDLTENTIRDFGLAHGLVDVKVCAVDEVWSGLKFVYRLKDR